jgi:tetratricopeptide (TPR) repeat protein
MLILLRSFLTSKNHKKMKYLLFLIGIMLGSVILGNAQTQRPDYVSSGREYFDKGKYEFAIYDFEKALHNGSAPEAYYWRGLCYYHLKNYKRAQADFDTLLANNRNFTQAYLQRGKIHLKLNNYEQALLDLQEAAKLDAENPELLNERVMVYHALARYEEAITDLKTLIRLRPNYFENYINLAGLQLQTRNFKEAVENYSKGIELMLAEKNTEDPDAYFARATAYLEIGDTAYACQDWKRAQDLGHPDAEEKKQLFCSDGAKK